MSEMQNKDSRIKELESILEKKEIQIRDLNEAIKSKEIQINSLNLQIQKIQSGITMHFLKKSCQPYVLRCTLP